MRTIISFIFVAVFCSTLQTQKRSYLDVLKSLASAENLELSYSPELVDLSETTSFKFSENTDTCLAELENHADIRISKTESHLIIVPAPPAIIELRGIVTDAQSGETLPYAHLLLKKTGSGTISNRQGIFSFKIAGKFAGEAITFSFLGYENTTMRVPYQNNDSLRVKMQAKPYTLADVYVLPNGNTAVDIVKRAVKNIKRNYHRTPAQIEMFYRNTNFRDSVASQLIEAVLLVEDKGITKPYSTTKVELKEARKSTNYLTPLSERWKKGRKIMEKMFGGHRNMFHRAVASNMVRQYKTDWWYKPLTDYETFKYEFEGFEWMDSVKVYKIKFIYDALWTNGKRASEIKNSEDAGFIYISSEDWGILRIEKYWKLFGEKAKKWKEPGDYLAKSEIDYQKVNGKYYVKYYKARTAPNGAFSVYENPDAPDKEKKIKERQWAEETLLVTQVTTNRKQFDKIKYREKLAKDENSYEVNYPYNAEFWKNYSVLKENPVEAHFIEEMEWEKSMDVQFEENSTNAENN